ncbi:uncharacterized protein [Cherax quadricarinatus]|uniref:uncharacterized protein isoform X1 n=1 Tax=Cherax quadricarinatus TaxID=27406 RepID=UPI00387EE2AF
MGPLMKVPFFNALIFRTISYLFMLHCITQQPVSTCIGGIHSVLCISLLGHYLSWILPFLFRHYRRHFCYLAILMPIISSGGSHCDSCGIQLEAFLATHPLHVLNTGTHTHFDPRTHTLSCIDLSVCSSSATLDFTWSVFLDLHDSNHFPIILTSPSHSPPLRNPCWQFDQANWNLYSRLTVLSEVPSSSSIDELLHLFSSSILTAASHSIPQTLGRHSQKCVPWWSPACARAVRLKRTVWGRYRYNRTTERLLDFKQKHAIARCVIHDAQHTCWRDYISTITSASSMSAVWKKVRKLSGKYSPDPAPVLRVAGVDIANPLDVANEIGNHLVRISQGLHLCPSFLSSKSARELAPLDFASLREEQYNVPFTLQELEATLSACQSLAAGPSDIHIRMLQHLHQSALAVLLRLFNLIW